MALLLKPEHEITDVLREFLQNSETAFWGRGLKKNWEGGGGGWRTGRIQEMGVQ